MTSSFFINRVLIYSISEKVRALLFQNQKLAYTGMGTISGLEMWESLSFISKAYDIKCLGLRRYVVDFVSQSARYSAVHCDIIRNTVISTENVLSILVFLFNKKIACQRYHL